MANSIPRAEHPNPQFERENWLNLNGEWEFEIDNSVSGRERGLQNAEHLSSKIIVPFCPESRLSGVENTDFMNCVWYRRDIEISESKLEGIVILHFGAVDQTATVWCNGVELATHTGGYLPFTVDITEVLAKENTILVCVRDATNKSQLPRGKQTLHPHGIWYTPQSGIWQTVWLESVPQNYIRSLHVTPLFDAHQVEITVEGEGQCMIDLEGKRFTFPAGVPAHVPVQSFRPWSPEHPTLYPFSVTLGDDTVYSYFAMRKCSVETDKDGVRRLFLNGKPYFHNGLLDQGYWPDGLYTAPSDDALVYDIQLAKDMGFNMLRKHIKIEPLRWYYHCDRLGIIVWQDLVSCFERWQTLTMQVLPFLGLHLHDAPSARLGRAGEAGRRQFLRDMEDTVDLLYNCVCLGLWVPFNEGWGQFDALAVTDRLRTLDPTRPIDHASGWHDQGGGDLKSRHVYYRPVRLRGDGRRVLALTEFGGYSLQCPGHLASDKKFGYRMYDHAAAWMDAVERLYETEVLPLIESQGLSAAVYTQLSDVEDEVNGLVTYDRRLCKMDPARMRKINSKLRF